MNKPSMDRVASLTTVDGHDIRYTAGMADLMHQITGSGRFLSLVLQLLIIFFCWETIPLWSIAPVIGCNLLGTFLSDRLRRQETQSFSEEEAESWMRAYARISVISGLSWGMAGYFWFAPGNLMAQAILFAAIIAIIVGTVLTRGMHFPSLMAFELPIIILSVGRIVREDLDQGLIFIALGILLLAALAMWSRTIQGNYREIIRLRSEREHLIGQLEAAKQRAEKDRDAALAGEKAKADFLAIISHEFRTPLNGIVGMAGLIGDRADLNEEVQGYLDALKVSADSLGVIVDDVLAMTASAATDTRDISEQAFNINYFVRQLNTLFTPRADEKRLLLTIKVANDVPAYLVGDESRIRQILFNLLSNAIKFTEDGAVSLLVSLVDRQENKARIRFAVADTGIGISSDTRKVIFEPFTQAEQGTTRSYGGAGLGLAISSRLAERMNSHIELESEPGEGSRFWFDLDMDVDSGETVDGVSEYAGQGIVLIVEDDPILAKVLKAGLIAAGYTTYHAATGEDALIMLEEGTVTHMLLDLGLPDMDGFAVLEEFGRMKHVRRDLPIVVLSGHGDEKTREKAIAAGARSVLVKPVDLNEILANLIE